MLKKRFSHLPGSPITPRHRHTNCKNVVLSNNHRVSIYFGFLHVVVSTTSFLRSLAGDFISQNNILSRREKGRMVQLTSCLNVGPWNVERVRLWAAFGFLFQPKSFSLRWDADRTKKKSRFRLYSHSIHHLPVLLCSVMHYNKLCSTRSDYRKYASWHCNFSISERCYKICILVSYPTPLALQFSACFACKTLVHSCTQPYAFLNGWGRCVEILLGVLSDYEQKGSER